MKNFYPPFWILILTFTPTVWADDFVPEDQENEIVGTSSTNFTIDSANSGGDLKLQFGTNLDEYLQWDATNLRFNLSDTLRVSGNLEQDGNILTLDTDNTGAGADIDIVAEQGSDSNGILRYSAANNRWEISNDGGLFSGIAAGGTMLVFDETLANNASTVLTHSSDSNNQRIIQVKEFITSTSDTDTSVDFDEVDEGNYIQENPTTGTDFLASSVRLSATFGGTGTTNMALNQPSSASSESQPSEDANDGDDGTFWYTTNGDSNGGWWQVDIGPSAPAINQAQIRWFNDTGTYNCNQLDIQGTNTDGSGYTTVYTADTSGDGQENTYNFTPAAYRYWRFLCTNAVNANFYVIREVRLFEALATYPTTPFYVTTNTNSLTTNSWDGLTTLDITQTTPTSTSVRYLVSFDGGTTWKYWNGSAWTNSSLANLQTQGMTETTIESISSAQWFAAGGINSDAAETLDFAIDLDTDDNAETPSVEGISVTFTTPNYWQVNTENYEIQEFNDIETQVTNKTGASQTVKISIMVP